MPRSERSHFVVKHDLDSLGKLPNVIWRTDMGPKHVPHRFDQVKSGDRWVAFAYTSGGPKEERLSVVTGFYECVKTFEYRQVPESLVDVSPYDWKKEGYAWIIEGKRMGERPRQPVGIPPIAELLDKPMWHNQAIIPITATDFDRIQKYTLSHEFDPSKIPLIGRQPACEQELLAIVVYGHKELGIEKIIRVRKAFPDLLVKIEGNTEDVHLELEVYSEGFFLHGHDRQVRKGRFKKDDKPVAVLCWIDNDPDVKDEVHRVYELQSLIREGKKIRW